MRDGEITWLPGMLAGWTDVRDLPALPREGFRDWWKHRSTEGVQAGPPDIIQSAETPKPDNVQDGGHDAKFAGQHGQEVAGTRGQGAEKGGHHA